MPRSVSYPFPVLGHGDDVAADPHAQASAELQDGRVFLKVHGTGGLPEEYEEELRNGRMGLAVRISCPRTYLRKTLLCEGGEGSFGIETQELAGPVQAEVLLVAKEDIPGFRCRAMNPDYGDAGFSLPAGAICGRLRRFSFEVPDRLTGGRGTGSLVRIRKEDSHDGPMDIYLESDRIVLTVGPDEWMNYQACKVIAPETLVAALVFPALVFALESVIRENGDDPELKGFLWYERLKEWVASDRVPERARDHPFLAAQHLLRMPVKSGLERLRRATSEDD